MKLKKWHVIFLILFLLILLCLLIFNIVYNNKIDLMNKNIVEGFSYLDEHYDEFDSYSISCSSNNLLVEDLNNYYDARFYNMNANIRELEEVSNYILENYNVKNLVINLSLINNFRLPPSDDDIIFGDSMPIGSKAEYLEKKHDFLIAEDNSVSMIEIDSTVKFIKNLKEKCEKKDVNFILVSLPVYYEHIDNISLKQINMFYKELVEITPFWDFSYSTISKDARYFYDKFNFRKSVSSMIAACMFDDKTIYYPEDLGVYVTNENINEYLEKYGDISTNEALYSTKLPIIMYHHITEDANNAASITPELFEEHIKTLKNMGYNAVSVNELIDYVEKGKELPENPICITFDDGYLSNYEIAFPILKKYQTKATIFVIGSSVGKSLYKDTNHSIIPHFNYEQALDMDSSGVISIQSHTYNMHDWAPYESGDKVRENVVELLNESKEEYELYVKEDFEKINNDFKKYLNKKITAVAYPGGAFSMLSGVVLKDLGVKVTFSTIDSNNTIIKGLPQSLFALHRYNINQEVSIEKLLEYITKE